MTTLREAATQALEALEYYQHRRLEWDYSDEVAINALKAALAEPVQEPVCEVIDGRGEVDWISFVPPAGTPLYTASPQRKPLTDEIIAELWHQNGGFHHHFARAIERWLKGNP